MKTLIFLFISLLFFSCQKILDPADLKLLRTESTDNYDKVFYVEYGYDDKGRITTITPYENKTQPVSTITVNYMGDQIILLGFPGYDPYYNQTKEMRLTIDENGRLLKRITYTHGVAKTTQAQPPERFTYDTLVYEYDTDGFLKKTTLGLYDSSWVDSDKNSSARLTSAVNYITDAGNLTSSDEYAVYTSIIRSGGNITLSGGSSEYYNQFRYSKSFPNQRDFKNAAVQNEYRRDYVSYEPYININYKNLPDQVIRQSIDKDINGSVTFNYSSTIVIDRTYNSEGLLSTVNILSHNAPYKEIKYFYGR